MDNDTSNRSLVQEMETADVESDKSETNNTHSLVQYIQTFRDCIVEHSYDCDEFLAQGYYLKIEKYVLKKNNLLR